MYPAGTASYPHGQGVVRSKAQAGLLHECALQARRILMRAARSILTLPQRDVKCSAQQQKVLALFASSSDRHTLEASCLPDRAHRKCDERTRLRQREWKKLTAMMAMPTCAQRRTLTVEWVAQDDAARISRGDRGSKAIGLTALQKQCRGEERQCQRRATLQVPGLPAQLQCLARETAGSPRGRRQSGSRELGRCARARRSRRRRSARI